MDFKEVLVLLKARDKFAKSRFSEKKELTNLRNKLAVQLIDKRGEFAQHRHSERLQILSSRM